MLPIIACAVFFFTFSSSHPSPFATQSVVSPIVDDVPSLPHANAQYPYDQNIRKNNPYFNNNPHFNNPFYNSQYFNQYNRVGGSVVPILAYSSEHSGDGTYAFSFTTADGKKAQENGFLKDAYIDNAGEPQGIQVVQGSFEYVSPEGTPVQVNYVADENGFRPSGVHIPADGKSSVLPLPGIFERSNKLSFDPFYTYNPYNPRSHHRQYKERAYDPTYPYNAARYNHAYNRFNKFIDVSHNHIVNEHKKTQ